MTASCWGICSTMCCREKLAPNSWPRSRGFDSSLRFVQFGPEVKCHCGASNCQGFCLMNHVCVHQMLFLLADSP
ncbi:hypothetical protein V6N11_071212 [Hibiscus sabdariffa]|uniref:Post-SET domain-containing protein n=1 Tax=Hibiscus sabdariffa TaxID=183260 RepID=A0ABR2TZP2_9ROSI